MPESEILHSPSRPPMVWPSFLQLILSALAAILLLGAGAMIALGNLFQFIAPGTTRSDLTQSFMTAASLVFAGVLLIPSAWYSWKSISSPEIIPVKRPERRGFGIIMTLIVVILVSGALLLGNLVSQNTHLDWFMLPLLNIIVVGLPALWLVYLGTRGLPLGSPRRRWGVFATGLTLVPLVITILEFIALIVMGLLAIAWATVNPSLSSQMTNLIIRLQASSSNPEATLRILLPFLLNPGILFIGFAFISIIVPMIEETLKPLGVWFLAGQKLTPVDGFVYGVLSGAGFGLFENLGFTSSGGEAWVQLASGRISDMLIHCSTAGMVGWALVSAWSQRRYLRLGITYLFAVLVHGLWNGMAVLSAASSLQGLTSAPLPADLQQIETYSTGGIVVLGIVILVIYIGFNTALRRGLPGINNSSFSQDLPPHQPAAESVPIRDGEAGRPPTGLISTRPPHTRENPSNTEDNPRG